MYPFVAYVALLMSPLRLGWSMSERCEVPVCFVGYWMMVVKKLVDLGGEKKSRWCFSK